MASIAQRRDLSDPDLIHAFAEEVGTIDRLEKLYLLTYADISTVGPRTWTEWKARLLRELFEKTRAVLERGERRPEPGTAEADGRGRARAALEAHASGGSGRIGPASSTPCRPATSSPCRRARRRATCASSGWHASAPWRPGCATGPASATPSCT